MSVSRICPRCASKYEDGEFCIYDGSPLQSLLERDLSGRTIAQRYVVGERIGRGGLSDVYIAEHTKMSRKCALKVMREGFLDSPDAVARFTREALNASRITHPNVASVYDFGDEDGVQFLAMEYVDGGPLSLLLHREGRLPPRRAAGIAWEIADALTAAHDLGIVHRDLKPENVMLTRHRDGSDWAKVVDFGLARIMSSSSQKVTSTGVVIGTQDYMSPEQLSGDSVDHRSDIYSLGLVFFIMLTGRSAFDGSTTQEKFAARLQGKAKTLAQCAPDLSWPSSIQNLLDRMLTADPRERLASAPEFASELVGIMLDWIPDRDGATEPWNQRLRFATPANVRVVSTRVPSVDMGSGPRVAGAATANPSAAGRSAPSATPPVADTQGESSDKRAWMIWVAVGVVAAIGLVLILR